MRCDNLLIKARFYAKNKAFMYLTHAVKVKLIPFKVQSLGVVREGENQFPDK
jgi:hypothetical protein